MSQKSTILFCLLLAGCGAQEIEVTPGPRLTEVLTDHDKAKATAKLKEVISRANDNFLGKIENCGFDKRPVRAETPNAYVQSIASETIKSGSAVMEAFRISSDITDFDELRSLATAKTYSMLRSSQAEGNTVVLAPSIFLPPSATASTQVLGVNFDSPMPIIIRTNCFEIPEGKTLSTDGRDLYIIADKVKVDGTIRTTPLTRDDLPGNAGGSLYIAAVVTDFGPNSVLDVSGGNGGEIKMSPTQIIDRAHPERAIPLIAELKSQFVEVVERKVGDRRLPRIEDAPALIDAWEKTRPMNFSAGETSVEWEIYNPDKFSEQNGDRREMENIRQVLSSSWSRDSERRNKFESTLAKKAWEVAIQESLLKFQKVTSSTEQEQSYWLIQGKLSVQIDEFEYVENIRSISGGKILKNIDRLIYQRLSGGPAGHLDLRFVYQSGEPKIIENDGLTSSAKDVKGVPEWTIASDTKVQIPLSVQKNMHINFQIRKDFDDKIGVNQVYETPKSALAQRTIYIEPYLTPSNADPKLILHPNERKSPLRPNEVHLVKRMNKDFQEIFSSWGIPQGRIQLQEAMEMIQKSEAAHP
jgi:hypothetical protein